MHFYSALRFLVFFEEELPSQITSMLFHKLSVTKPESTSTSSSTLHEVLKSLRTRTAFRRDFKYDL